MTGDPARGLIDTNIVVHPAALDPALMPDDMVISAVTLAELSAGPHHTDDPGDFAGLDPLVTILAVPRPA